jgi:hypothetical protein
VSEDKFNHLDTVYKSLTAAAKKKKLVSPEEVKSLSQYLLKRQDGESCTPDISELSVTEDKGGESDSFDYGEFGGDDDEIYIAPLATSVLPSDDRSSNVSSAVVTSASEIDPLVEEVCRFHAAADDYMDAFRLLVIEFVKRKQNEVVHVPYVCNTSACMQLSEKL